MIDYAADQAVLHEIVEVGSHADGAATIQELERLLAEADSHGLIHAAIFARTLLAMQLMMADANDITPILGLFAESHQLLEEHQAELINEVLAPVTLHMFGVLIMLREQPAVPLQRIEEARALYEQMCRQGGMSLRGAYVFSMLLAIMRGDHAAAERFFALSQSEPRDWYIIYDSVEFVIEWYADRGMDDEAIIVFQRATSESEGRYWSAVQLAAVLPALRSGRAELAALLYQESWDQEEFGAADAPRLTYLTLVGRPDDALALLPDVKEDPALDTPRSRAFAAEHAVVLLSRLEAAGRGDEPVAGMGATISELHQPPRCPNFLNQR